MAGGHGQIHSYTVRRDKLGHKRYSHKTTIPQFIRCIYGQEDGASLVPKNDKGDSLQQLNFQPSNSAYDETCAQEIDNVENC